MTAIMSPLLEALAKLAAATMERVPEIRSALAPYLHARVRLTMRVELVTDGPEGPLPDPVVELTQSAVVSVDGLKLDGPPSVRASLSDLA